MVVWSHFQLEWFSGNFNRFIFLWRFSNEYLSLAHLFHDLLCHHIQILILSVFNNDIVYKNLHLKLSGTLQKQKTNIISLNFDSYSYSYIYRYKLSRLAVAWKCHTTVADRSTIDKYYFEAENLAHVFYRTKMRLTHTACCISSFRFNIHKNRV